MTRCVGNCLRLVQQNHMKDQTFLEIVEQVLKLISKNMLCNKSMKLKWNACYAAQTLMKNDNIFNDLNILKWQVCSF